jgi:MFS family permease
LIIISCIGYLIAAINSIRLGRNGIGPLEHEVSNEIKGYKEMASGFIYLRNHGDALRGIFATAIQRGGLTAMTLMALLLERNTFNPSANPDAGLRGFAFTLAVAGFGVGLGAFVGPIGVLKFGRHRWIKISMVAPIPLLIAVGVFPSDYLLIVTAFFVAGFGQSVKVSNDALVQAKITDVFRGRVFAFYDVAVNGAIVTGAVIAALILPTSGKSISLPIIISAIFIVTNLLMLKRSSFAGH